MFLSELEKELFEENNVSHFTNKTLATQFKVTVRSFIKRQIIISLHYEGSLYSGMSNNLYYDGSSYSSLIFYFFFYVLFLSKGNVFRPFCSTILLRVA